MAETQPPPPPPSEARDPTPLLRRFQIELADVQQHAILPEHLKHSRELVDIDVMHLPARPGVTPFFSFLSSSVRNSSSSVR